ncbi:MAG TPA: alpha/beta fold hydrolase [Acidobacteriota bacterium]|nr:alpha/beta fold hydrolase [Acidobacteriota bacterium]
MIKPVPAKARIGRFFRLILPAAIILVCGFLVFLGFLVNRVIHPGAVPEPVNPSSYLMTSLDVHWTANDGFQMTGWWIPGLPSRPGILLVPGLGMGKSDALSLALLLHQDGFNVLVYDVRGSGTSPQIASSLGLQDTDDMLAALRYVKSRRDLDVKRLGIWGVDVGARAALQASAAFPEVRAIAADGAYERVLDMVDVRVRETFGLQNRLLELGCRQAFRIMHIGAISLLNKRLDLDALSDRSILCIVGENRKDLGRLTNAIYLRLRPQKEITTLRTSRIRTMSGEELRDYDRQVATFFHLNLPDADRHM